MTRTRRIYYQTQETVTTHKKGWVELEIDFVQVFHKALTTMLKVQYLNSIKLMFFLLKKYPDDGLFEFNETLIEEFNQTLHQSGNQPIKRTQVEKYMTELTSLRLLIRVKRGSYHINPHAFWADALEERIELLKLIKATGKDGKYQVEEIDISIQKSTTSDIVDYLSKLPAKSSTQN